MAVTVKILTAANANRWDRAKIKASSKSTFASVAKKLVAAKDRYQAIEDETGVPWFVIAVIHQRESSQRWDRSIAQGDPWNKKSTHVPKGRGPFKSFEEAAVDALKNCAPYAARWKDWSPGGTMTLLEHYNGLGYANRGLPSPYIWSGTDQYSKGKYVEDGKFSATAVDKQLGCAGLIIAMQQLDPSIAFDGDEVAEGSKAVIPAGIEIASAGDTFPVQNRPTVSANQEIDDVVPTRTIAFDPNAKETILDVQEKLLGMGYHEVGKPDGAFGPNTAKAIAAYKFDKKIDGAPIIDEALATAVNESAAKKECRLVPLDRATVTAKELAPHNTVVQQSFLQKFWAKITGVGALIIAAFQAVADQFHVTKEYIEPYMSWFSDIPGWLWFVGIAGVALLVVLSSNRIEESIVQAKRTNRLN